MPFIGCPSQTPGSFVTFAPECLLIGDPAAHGGAPVNAITLRASPPAPNAPGANGGFVLFYSCGPRGGARSPWAAVAIFPAVARSLSGRIRFDVLGAGKTTIARFDPTIVGRDRYADSPGLIEIAPTSGGFAVTIVSPPLTLTSGRLTRPALPARPNPVIVSGNDLLRFAAAIDTAADIADGILPATSGI